MLSRRIIDQFSNTKRYAEAVAERERRSGQSEFERLREEGERLEASLIDFHRAAWPEIDPAPYVHGWHLEAIADHLQAVAQGEIRKLVINVPPRHSKSLLTSVSFPGWVWAQARDPEIPLCGPQVKFMCLSYGDVLANDHATLCRRLVVSEWYQRRWGFRVQITRDQDAKNKFDTTAGGTRIASSFAGVVLGRGADIKVIDDPIKADEAESEVSRERVNRIYDGTLKSRVTDPRLAATIIIMQRLHDEDLTGHVLENDFGFVHLFLPAEYEWQRHCATSIGWNDPRGLDEDDEPLVLINEYGNRSPRDAAAEALLWDEREGELLWPERFGPAELASFKINPYEWSGQWQQSPTPRGGGIFKREWWQLWEPEGIHSEGGQFPVFSYRVASLDSAYTEREQNDPSGFTVWGVFHHERLVQSGLPPELVRYAPMFSHTDPVPRVMLIDAWRSHLRLHGEDVPYLPDEEAGLRSDDEVLRNVTMKRYERRASATWGLVEKVAHSCRRHKVDVLLIEAKGSGLDVAHEMERLYSDEPWRVHIVQVRTDKIARAHAVVPVFARKLVYAPDREWSELVIKEMEEFPKGKRDDLTDSATQAIKHLRETGIIRYPDQQRREEFQSMQHRPKRVKVYPMQGGRR